MLLTIANFTTKHIGRALIPLTHLSKPLSDIINTHLRKLTFYSGLILLIVLLVSSNVLAMNTSVKNDTLKAVFLERFTRFIDWPENHNSEPPIFVIGVVGNDSFASLLQSVYRDKKIRQQRVTIKLINTPKDIENCHLVFISNNAASQLTDVINLSRHAPILTVGDSAGFAEQGVLINFYSSGNKIRFEINETAVKNSGLHMSYKLLSVAKIVEPIEK